jgi:CelD/BcsL family acetyltransferase involved in cellulose biosynthesis
VRPLTLEEFRSRRKEYETLLASSAADPLFHSFDWLELWWIHFGQPDAGEQLRILAAERDGRLAGVLPVVQNLRAKKGLLRYRSSAVLGNMRGISRGVPTEYTTVVAEPGDEQSVLSACLKCWHTGCRDREISAGWCVDPGLWVRSIREVRAHSWEHVRITDPITAYGVDLRQGFAAYRSNLSANARRSMFNLRTKLVETIGLTFRMLDPADSLAALDRMNELHALRWKSPAFTGSRLAFHRDLITRLGAAGELAFSEMHADGRLVSVLYDIRCRGRQYNIQMGFDAAAIPNGSPGVIHLGFAIEEAAASGVAHYDFLAGQGLQSDYKRRYANSQLELGTVQHLRGPALNLAMHLLAAARRGRGAVA